MPLHSRILYIDVLKLFTMFLVLWGHAILHFQPDYDNSIPYQIIHSFHMSLFMMLSGYFAQSSMDLDIYSFFPKKFRQLLLPWISWSLLCWLFISSGLIYGTFRLEIHRLFTGWLNLIDNYWFLKSCFFCYSLTWLCWRCRRWGNLIAMLIWLSLLFVGRFNLEVMFPSFLFGLWLRRNQGEWLSSNKILLVVGSVFLLLLSYTLFVPSTPLDFCLRRALRSDVFSWSIYSGQLIYKILLGLFGALFCFITFQKMMKSCTNSPIVKKLASWGGKTLGIYILQAIILETLMPLYISFTVLPISVIPLLMPLLSLIVLLLCLFIVRVIERNNLLSCLLWGQELKK